MAILSNTVINGSLTLNNGSTTTISDVQNTINNMNSKLIQVPWTSCATSTVGSTKNTYVKFCVYNGIVFVHGTADAGYKIGNINTQNTLGVIPSAYKPPANIYILSTIQSAQTATLQVNIKTASGNIDACVLSSSATADYWKFDISYPLLPM